MDPVAKALWFIEGNFTREITLDDIASVAGVSRFHLTRAFGDTMAMPVMRYLRARRLTEAARSLAGGAPDILSVALDAGYGSHEAFTRAFRDQFGMTPEEVRDGSIASIQLVEPKLVQQELKVGLAAPRIVESTPMLIAGIGQRYEYGPAMDGIPAQWQRFQPYIGNIPRQVGDVAYGVIANDDENGFDYIAGVEVTDFSGVDPQLARIRIAAQRHAVFARDDHLSSMRGVIHAIMNGWLPTSGYGMADAPMLERYGETFDPISGNGGWEIWVPVKG
jgi:AraC family transcriptional regulator